MSDLKTERWIKENVEAIAIAIVMALVIRQFAIEAFKIPTESMAPTLLGDNGGGGTGDRILVYKVPYLLGEPKRWDVVVFKYPLNISKNYIKRLVGKGGETLQILDGDVVIDGKVARKPRHVMDVMFQEHFPGKYGPMSLRKAWATSGSEWERTGDDAFVATSPGGTATARFARPYDGGDVRLTASIRPGTPGELFWRIVENGVVFELHLAVGDGETYLMADGTRHPVPDVRLAPDETTEVVFTNVDDTILIDVGGRAFRLEYESIANRMGDDSVAFGVTNGTASFEDVRLDVDVHYGAMVPSTVEIPEGHYFVLGDNTGNSQDSRRWELKVTKLRDGTVYEWDRDQKDLDVSQMPPRESGYQVVMDRFGIWRKWKESDEAGESHRPYHFVPSENMIGKAFFVFWPLNPFNDQFRLKFIR